MERMNDKLRIGASADYERVIVALLNLFRGMRVNHAFVGTVAGSAWLGRHVEDGSIEALVAVGADGARTLPMMAQHRGFVVDQNLIEASEELDLVPLSFPAQGGEIRVHVLLATNALYGRMIAAARDAHLRDIDLRIVCAEDFGLLLSVAEDESSAADLERLIESFHGFDLDLFNRKLQSIGLGHLTVTR